MNQITDTDWLKETLALANQAAQHGEVPVGALIIYKGECIARAYNQAIDRNDPTAHAEIVALRTAGAFLKNYRLIDCDLYVTLEPCPMCAMAIIHARIRRVVFSATDPRIGAVCSHYQLFGDKRLNHSVRWEQGAYSQEVRQLLQQFFQDRRNR